MQRDAIDTTHATERRTAEPDIGRKLAIYHNALQRGTAVRVCVHYSGPAFDGRRQLAEALAELQTFADAYSAQAAGGDL